MNYVIDENKNLVNIDIQELAFNAAHPIGEIYVQYPGKKDPQTLYGRGTWTNKSSEFAGLFFRAEGGNASAFNSGSQEDKIRNIIGAVSGASSNSSYLTRGKGCFSYNTAYQGGYGLGEFGGWNSNYYHVFDANANNNNYGNPMAGHADGPEIRPVNVTIRIWERTA